MLILNNRKKSLKAYHIDYIKENCRNMTTEQIANQFGCSASIVTDACRKMYIKPIQKQFAERDFVPPELVIY